MKKVLVLLVLVCFSMLVFAAPKFHIGVVTGTVSQAEDDLRGAEALIKKYGDVAKGGMVKHVTYPDNFTQEMQTVIAQIVGLADDPDMKAIIVNQAVPGTVEAFRKVREKNPNILLLAGVPHEDPGMIAQYADVVVDADNVQRGYLIIKAAQKMGAKKFMHISFPRHMSYELLSRRRNIMEQACKDLGIQFIPMSAPDPTSDVGIAGAQQFILEKVPEWLKMYGKDTAFFCTNDAQTESLIKRVVELGGYFVEADLPSPTMGYPGALGIEFTDAEKGNWPAILKKVEAEVIKKGGKGRLGTWAFSMGYTVTAGLGEFAINIVDKKAKKNSQKDLFAAFGKYTPGAQWNGSNYVDAKGVKRTNYVLVYQDTYVLGKGYLGMTKEKVPEKYAKINATK